MSRTITTYQANYDLNKIEQFRLDGHSWRKIAKFYNVKHPAAMNYYKKHSKKASKRKKKTTDDINEKEQLPDYGELPPKIYTSKLNNDDWTNKYAGGEWKSSYLTLLRNFIWTMLSGMFQAPRGHGKTFSTIALFVRWMLEVRTEILCYTNAGMKSEIFENVKYILMSDEIRRDYGDVLDKNRGAKWDSNKGSIRLVDELRTRFSNFRVIGETAKSVGFHGGWIHLEDIIQDISVSMETERKLHRWFNRIVKYMRKYNTKVTITGTRKDPEDFYEYLEVEKKYPMFKLQAINLPENTSMPAEIDCTLDNEQRMVTEYPNMDYGSLGCPDAPIGKLLYDYFDDPEGFEAEMQNNPIPSMGRAFSGDDWIEVDEVPNGTNYELVDPAFGQSSSSSKTAIIMLCISPTKFTIIDMFIGRLGLTDKADMVTDFHRRHKPFQLLMEDNFRQITTRYEPDHPMMQLRGLTMVDSFDNKRHRIEALKFPYRKKTVQILASCPFKKEFKAEYLSYSEFDSDAVIRTKYNALDALSMGYLKLKHFMRHAIAKMKMGALGRRF